MIKILRFLAVSFLFFPVFPIQAAELPMPMRQIGIVEELTGPATVTSASGQVRPLALHVPVFVRDKITTEGATRIQIRLHDMTVFVISENSEISLDEFVYDPPSGAGIIKVHLKGVFRFVTGKIVKQQPENMKVELPVGVIGIRGTRVAGRADERGSFVMLEAPGQNEEPGRWLSVGNEVNGQFVETVIQESGYGTNVYEGQAPEAAVQIAMDILNALITDLGGLDEALNANLDENMFADILGNALDSEESDWDYASADDFYDAGTDDYSGGDFGGDSNSGDDYTDDYSSGDYSADDFNSDDAGGWGTGDDGGGE